MNREGLSERRKHKIILTLNQIGRLGFLKPTQKNMDNYFNWLRESELAYPSKLTNWFIYTRYMKWLNPRLKFEYKLSATVKQILPEI